MTDPKPDEATAVEAAPEAPIVEIEALAKDYMLGDKRIEVLKSVDLTLNVGERLSIVGKSGVGKSTFLHVLGTLDRPSSGKIMFEGKDVFSFSEAKLSGYRNRSIGMVFQFHYLLPDFSALENVMIPMRIAAMDFASMSQRAETLLEQVGLSDRMLHRPGELSGGEQQRVAIARALAMQPKLLLADEPTGNLDEQTSEGIHDVLVQLNETYKTTLVVVTHNHRLADRMGRRLRLADGIITERES